jgi:hypothetical protein
MGEKIEEMGPIDYVVVEFPGNKMTGEAFPHLVNLVDRGIIRLIDLEFISKDKKGNVSAIKIGDIDGDGTLDLTIFEGASSGIIGQDEIDDAGSVIEPNSSAALLIYENAWAAPFASALRRSGAQLVASGRIPVQAMLAATENK